MPTRPIIDVQAREHPEPASVPAVARGAAPPPQDPLQALQAQLEILHDQHRALRELMARMRERVLAPNLNQPDAGELMRMHARLVDRSIEAILSAFSRPHPQDDHDV